jgi:hypothetical protein
VTDDVIAPGCVLHWDGFKFPDGTEADKFFVIVGAQTGKNYLAIIATSQRKRGRVPVPGGNPEGGWYHIPGGGKDFFKVDTWLLFEEPQELSAKELLALKFKNSVKIVGKLRPDIANAICNCMRKCDDVSELHRGMLGPAIQLTAKTK